MTSQIIESVEGHALRMGRLHPAVVAVLRPHFAEVLDLSTVEVRIHKVCWWRSTPCIVSRGVIHFAKGVLNSTRRWTKGAYDAVYFNLASRSGMARLGHECVHVRQWRENPGKMLRQNINAVGRIIAKGDVGEWWESPFEQEAIAKEAGLRQYFQDHPTELLPFRELR